MNALTVGVDVGGTKVAAGVVDVAGTVLAQVRRPTPGTAPEEVADTIAACVKELSAAHEVAGVGIGAAGYINSDRSTVLFAPNLVWRNEPLQAIVAERTGLPVVVENDANAAAWGEFRFGAGRDAPDLAMVTVGTGIGGGLVLDGRLQRGAHGIAAEFGHIQMVPGGRRCGCEQRGCWEMYASGRALVYEARSIATVWPGYGKRLLELGDGTPEGITGPEVTQAAQEGDPAAVECFDVIGGWLGQGLADLVALLDPSVLVVGGGVVDAGELLLAPVRRRLDQLVTGRGHRPVAAVLAAELGPLAGLVGAADLARQS